MRHRYIGRSGLRVSPICMGTMTFGATADKKESFKIMDKAYDAGINFYDTAELYPVPPDTKWMGQTESIVGEWLQTKPRDSVILATKVAGAASGWFVPPNRHGLTAIDRFHIEKACEDSLRRLKIDYIDLYQLHWPERNTNTFGVRNYKHNRDDTGKDNFNDILHTLDGIIKEGKIRHVGISNEKAWGTMRYLEESKKHNLPRMISIQNAYSLLNRVFEGDMAEIAMRENIKLLAYSPMAFGVLSGKYIKGTAAENARLKLFPRFARYSSEQSTEATKAYLTLAEDNDMSLAQMSLAFVTQQPFVLANIIGATTLEQLEENIDSINVELSKELLAKINAIHTRIPNPAP